MEQTSLTTRNDYYSQGSATDYTSDQQVLTSNCSSLSIMAMHKNVVLALARAISRTFKKLGSKF